MQAHIAEHLGYKMRKMIEAQLGMPAASGGREAPAAG
jgi:hypothetical protein